MANNWFRFKQFIIRQDKTAMKVGTDGVLLGAWTDVSNTCSILDIGTGTGLISLMLAQRCNAKIDAIEIDPDAYIQSTENILESPWSDRIQVYHHAFSSYCSDHTKTYDLIVCNPPFFSNSLKSDSGSRNIARHDDQLTPEELFNGVCKLLNTKGHFCIIHTAERETDMISLGKRYKLFPAKILRIRPKTGKEIRRILIDYSFTNQNPIEDELVIETGLRHQYSEGYIDLTREFYL